MKYGKSFRNAIESARNTEGRVTVFFNGEEENGKRHAVYDVPRSDVGEMYVNGFLVTVADLPATIQVRTTADTKPTSFAFATCIAVAEEVFRFYDISIEKGWESRP